MQSKNSQKQAQPQEDAHKKTRLKKESLTEAQQFELLQASKSTTGLIVLVVLIMVVLVLGEQMVKWVISLWLA